MRQFLQQIPALYELNARIKAAGTRRQYHALCRDYGKRAQGQGIVYSEESAVGRLRESLEIRGVIPRPVPRGEIRTLYIGTDIAQDTGGFLQSLETFGPVYRFTQSDGTYGQYGGRGERREAEGQRLLELVAQARKEGPLHLVFGQMWNRTMPWQSLDAVRRLGIPVANISMDDRHAYHGDRVNGEWWGIGGVAPGVDLVLTAAPEACLWYAVEGTPAIFWPEASDPAIFHPMAAPKEHDVCFVGANYGVRARVVQALQRRGVAVTCYGNGWGGGRLPTEEVPALFASSKIVLGVGTIKHCSDVYSLKMRDFDATLSGSLYVTHANPDLDLLFEVGEEIVCYHTPEECAERCAWYLEHEAEREKIARAGLARSLRDHTWEKRFEKLFGALGILEG
ncbi:glycosyltransferase [bacterium]|nr:glycosyltransferase [bacterium]